MSAFAVDPASGKLKLINQRPSGGGGPCHVSVDPGGKCVLAANYGGGSVCSFPIGADGGLKEIMEDIYTKFPEHNPNSEFYQD